MKTEQIIEKFLSYAGFNGWQTATNYSPLISHNKLLFHISGGVQHEKALAGLGDASCKKLVSVQACIRTDNWEQVGNSGRHHLSFLMLGHFMFFADDERATKTEMISFAANFLLSSLGISPSNLIVTVHPDDSTSKEIWQSYGLSEVREQIGNTSFDPLMARSGSRTEIIWRSPTGRECELWNIVFHSCVRGEEKPSSLISADSGVSLDRLARAVAGTDSNYLTSSWNDYLSELSCTFGKAEVARYGEMLKAGAELLSCGLCPGNKAASYVLRKIIREAFLINGNMAHCLNDFVMTEAFWLPPGYTSNKKAFGDEMELYDSSLSNGRKACDKLLAKHGHLSVDDLRFLHETHGYPQRLARLQEEQWTK